MDILQFIVFVRILNLKRLRKTRDTREKLVVFLDELETKLAEILETMQSELLERARKHQEEHTYTAVTYEEFQDIADL